MGTNGWQVTNKIYLFTLLFIKFDLLKTNVPLYGVNRNNCILLNNDK